MELRKIKHLEYNSKETPCFTAQLWVDGNYIGEVSNDGNGGCNELYPSKGFQYKDIEMYETLDNECKIFKIVEADLFRKKFQSTAFVLKRDNKVYKSNFNFRDKIKITKAKKSDWYKSWVDERIKYFKSEDYIILNKNL